MNFILDDSFGWILAIASLVIGVMVLTGNGGMFLKGGGAKEREELYDVKKMEKASGIALIGFGVLTGIDTLTTTFAAKVGYVAAMAVGLVAFVIYVRTKCRKK